MCLSKRSVLWQFGSNCGCEKVPIPFLFFFLPPPLPLPSLFFLLCFQVVGVTWAVRSMTSVTLSLGTARAWRMLVGVTALPASPTTGGCWVQAVASAATAILRVRGGGVCNSRKSHGGKISRVFVVCCCCCCCFKLEDYGFHCLMYSAGW